MPTSEPATMRVISERPIKAVYFGAAPDTGNLGVNALSESVVAQLFRRLPRLDMIVADNKPGWRELDAPDGARQRNCGIRLTRRWNQPESLFNLRASNRLRFPNPVLRELRGSIALDISGGDSFTDLYGSHRFNQVTAMKAFALEAGLPLVLLPQTYGPFKQDRERAEASRLVTNAAGAWARDERSFDVLKGLLGSAFDEERHACGVDVAFLLPVIPEQGERPEAEVGLNVSGLLFNDPEAAIRQYGFKADYRQVILDLIERLVADGRRIVLVPHVLGPDGVVESDPWACRRVLEMVSPKCREHLRFTEGHRTAGEAKGVIARCEWFCGTRMHSTIGALSSLVPTAAIAYSPKTLGVFESCDQGEHVADPMKGDTREVVERLWWSYEHRAESARSLEAALPRVKDAAEQQFDRIAATMVGAAGG